ncbi:conserved hypothetical protein [Leishmania mexicana MHOM/GT/2001/U1103]|uniref:Uncharacterized protein n=1 Tax=Leishmania mexicana (strain MHOM/GT/2001/U1103) TaxID=929439 RepID=E9AM20_LEIMU|nr:conserved hypothetical protein [Leishmania mexicana MHOM/GT/2001/U1103]CBZ23975.1 conserved hypothetical protein [Leishmania mexicana MHOM/GT/2001/U1103]
MPTTSAPSPLLPTLRPASGTMAAPQLAMEAGAEAASASSNEETGIQTNTYDEDWHRLPSEISYFQDLLASLEEKQQLASAASSPNAAATSGLSYSTSLQRERELEEREMADLCVRERQVTIIEARRRRSRRRCDAVDEAFQNALKRRWQAMQHLAADPPAERLVGQGMTQYVPAALLPDDVVDRRGRRQPGPLPLAPQSAVEARIHRTPNAPAITGAGPTLSTAVRALKDCSSGTTAEQDAIVFLTQLDAGGRVVRKDGATGGSHSPTQSPSVPSRVVATASSEGVRVEEEALPPATSAPAASAVSAEALTSADVREDDSEDEGGWIRPATVTEANKARWQEMGYHVIVVGGKGRSGAAAAREADAVRRAIRSVGAISTEGVAQRVAEQRTATSSSLMRRKPPKDQQAKCKSVPEWDWMQLAPLPQVCLVQRRLPEEDMTVAELRERYHRHIPVTSSTTSVPRGRQNRGDRPWRVSDKSVPH